MAMDAINAMLVASDVGALFFFAGSAFGFVGFSDDDGGAAGPFVVACTVALLAGSSSADVPFDGVFDKTGRAGPVRLTSALELSLTLALATGATRSLDDALAALALPAGGGDGADALPPSPGAPATTDGAPPALTDDDTCSKPGLFGVSLQLSVLQQQISL
jgi:hypothetical protein